MSGTEYPTTVVAASSQKDNVFLLFRANDEMQARYSAQGSLGSAGSHFFGHQAFHQVPCALGRPSATSISQPEKEVTR